MREWIATTLLFVVGVGCVSSTFVPVGGRTYPPRPSDYLIDVYVPVEAPVIVLQSFPNAKRPDQVPAGATVIGRIDTQGAPAAAWKSVIEDAEKKARELGGDAVVIGQWGHPLTGVDGYGNTYYGKAVSMTVLRYPGDLSNSTPAYGSGSGY